MFVYRLKNDLRVERVFIEAALSDKTNIEPAGGLEPGDRVVVAGQAGLKNGARVSLPETDASSEGAGEEAESDVRVGL
jgi:multidrug efflux pump subunit AcrA (membrane-fusion protein)